jgi:hypothetical protein
MIDGGLWVLSSIYILFVLVEWCVYTFRRMMGGQNVGE